MISTVLISFTLSKKKKNCRRSLLTVYTLINLLSFILPNGRIGLGPGRETPPPNAINVRGTAIVPSERVCVFHQATGANLRRVRIAGIWIYLWGSYCPRSTHGISVVHLYRMEIGFN